MRDDVIGLVMTKSGEEIFRAEIRAEIKSHARVSYDEDSFTLKIDDRYPIRLLLRLFHDLLEEVEE